MLLFCRIAGATAAAEKVANCVVLIFVMDKDDKIVGSATGFVVRDDGLIVTADHVVFEQTTNVELKVITTLFPEGRDPVAVRLRVISRMRKVKGEGADIAFVKPAVPTKRRIKCLEIGPVPDLGDMAIVVGFPKVFDKPAQFPFVRSGVVTCTKYKMDNEESILLDMTAVPGFSGAPVADSVSGRVFGVFSGFSESTPNNDFSYAFTLTADDLPSLSDEGAATSVEIK